MYSMTPHKQNMLGHECMACSQLSNNLKLRLLDLQQSIGNDGSLKNS